MLTDSLLLKNDLPPEIYYCPCTPERISIRRVIKVFFMKSMANYYIRVRIEVPSWTNFSHGWMELLKGACSRNCIPISFKIKYLHLYSQLIAGSTSIIQHGKGSNESKKNCYIDVVIYIYLIMKAITYLQHNYIVCG
jgi:hypothetical protein